MFELPAVDNCGQYFDTGDVLCIGKNSLRIVRKWGLAVKLEASHGAEEDEIFSFGQCHQEHRRLIFTIESISTAVALAYDNIRQKISTLLASPETGETRILSSSTVPSADNVISVFSLSEDVFGKPRDVAILRDGNFVIADTGNHRVVVVIGNFLDVVAGNGVTTTAMSPDGGPSLSQLKFPTAVAVLQSGKSNRRYDALFIVDAGNFRVVRWRFAALRGEVVWQAENSQKAEITGFGKISVDESVVRFVVKKNRGDVLVTLRGDALVPRQQISDIPAVLWTVDDGNMNDNIYLDVEIEGKEFPGIYDLTICKNFASSRVTGKIWKSDGSLVAGLGGFVALAEEPTGVFGINEDGVVWTRVDRAIGQESSTLIQDEL
jgi:hypothetical protein